MSLLYLDNAATTPVRPEVLEAMAPYLTRWFGNASSHHTVGETAAAALDDARARVARVVGMRASDVIFTSGGTESDNLAVKGIAVAARQNRGARHVVTSPIEHEAMADKIDSYGKTWHVWKIGMHEHEGDELPLGEPHLAWSFNRDGEAKPGLVAARDEKLGVDTQEKRKSRQDLVARAKPQCGVDALRGRFAGETTPIEGVRQRESGCPGP